SPRNVAVTGSTWPQPASTRVASPARRPETVRHQCRDPPAVPSTSIAGPPATMQARRPHDNNLDLLSTAFLANLASKSLHWSSAGLSTRTDDQGPDLRVASNRAVE